MTIPPKYEDVVAQLALEREQEESMLGELEDLVEKLNNALGEIDILQQRLTVAEQRAFELTGLLKLSLLAVDDVAENCKDQTDWATANSMRALSRRITDALKPAEG